MLRPEQQDGTCALNDIPLFSLVPSLRTCDLSPNVRKGIMNFKEKDSSR